jgi:hypothetical protein
LKTLPILALALLAQPLAAQAWDLRLEAPFPKGQSLPATAIQDAGPASGGLDTGQGVIFTVGHRIMRVNPVLKFEWNAEFSQLQASGQIHQGQASAGSRLSQSGIGAGVNAQFWVPFTGFAGELALLGRLQSYRYAGAGAAQTETLLRPWLRTGLRWNLPFPGIEPYLAASYQVALVRDQPVQQDSAPTLPAYLSAQGAGQEFDRMWTVGVGVTF